MRRAKLSSRPNNEDLLGNLGSTDVNGGDLAVQHWQNRRKQADARSFLAWSERSAPPPPKEPEPKAKPDNNDVYGELNEADTPAPLTLQERQRRLNQELIAQAKAELAADEPEDEYDRTRAALAPYQPREDYSDDEEN